MKDEMLLVPGDVENELKEKNCEFIMFEDIMGNEEAGLHVKNFSVGNEESGLHVKNFLVGNKSEKEEILEKEKVVVQCQENLRKENILWIKKRI